MAANNNAKKTVTAEDVVAEAAEKKLITVPAQSEDASEPKVVTGKVVEEGETGPDLELIEGGKVTLKERLASITEKLKQNKKVVAGVAVTVGLATVAFVKFAAKQAVEEALDEDEAALGVITGEADQQIVSESDENNAESTEDAA